MKLKITLLALCIFSYPQISEGGGTIDASILHKLETSTPTAECSVGEGCLNAIYRPNMGASERLDIALFERWSRNEGFRFLPAMDAQGNPSHQMFNYIGRICAEPAPGENTQTASISTDAGSGSEIQENGVYCSTFVMINACEFVTAQHALFPRQVLEKGMAPIQRRNISIGWGFPLRSGADRTRLEAFPNRAEISNLTPNLQYFPHGNGRKSSNGVYYVNRDYDCVTARIKGCEPGNPKKSFQNSLDMFSLNRYKSKKISNCRVAGFEVTRWISRGEIMVHEQCRSVGDSFANLYSENGWRSFCSSAPGASGGPLVCDINGKPGIVGFASGGSAEILESGRGQLFSGTESGEFGPPVAVVNQDDYGGAELDDVMNTFAPAGNCMSSTGHIRVEF